MGGVKNWKRSLQSIDPTDWTAGAEPKVGGLGKWHPLARETERMPQRFLKTHQRPYLFQSYRLWKLHVDSPRNSTGPPISIFTLSFFLFSFFLGFKPQTRDSYTRPTSSTYYNDVWNFFFFFLRNMFGKFWERKRERCVFDIGGPVLLRGLSTCSFHNL